MFWQSLCVLISVDFLLYTAWRQYWPTCDVTKLVKAHCQLGPVKDSGYTNILQDKTLFCAFEAGNIVCWLVNPPIAKLDLFKSLDCRWICKTYAEYCYRNLATVRRLVQSPTLQSTIFCGVHSDLRGKGIRVSPAWSSFFDKLPPPNDQAGHNWSVAQLFWQSLFVLVLNHGHLQHDVMKLVIAHCQSGSLSWTNPPPHKMTRSS